MNIILGVGDVNYQNRKIYFKKRKVRILIYLVFHSKFQNKNTYLGVTNLFSKKQRKFHFKPNICFL